MNSPNRTSDVTPLFEPLETRLLLSANLLPPSEWDAGATALLASEIIGWDGDPLAYTALGSDVPTGDRFMASGIDPDNPATWIDAEKIPPDDGGGENPGVDGTDDDLMCWAAGASNILEWTGWGFVDGMSNTDEMFQRFQNHWTDYGCWPKWAWKWWFDGTDSSGAGGSWEDVDGEGEFYPPPDWDFWQYYHEEGNDSQVMSAIDQYLHNGYGATIGIFPSQGLGHIITVWGFNYDLDDPAYYKGIWVTDSDDNRNDTPPPDMLQYYEVLNSGGKWYLPSFANYRISIVQALEPMPGNHRPVLSNPSVTPLSGDASDTYIFQVDYYDQDGDPPLESGGKRCANVYLSGGRSEEMDLVAGNPADGTYQCSISNLDPGNYQHFFSLIDSRGLDQVSGWHAGPYVGQPQASELEIWADGWDDPDGDGDGYPEAGESVECQVILENIGGSVLTNVQAWLSTSVGNVDITDNHVWYGDISPGDYEIASDRFNMFLDFASTWSNLPFNLHVTYMNNGQEYWQDLGFHKTFYEDGVRAPEIVVDQIVWHDSERGDGDGILESGEEADMYLYIKNVGSAHAKHVDVTVEDVPQFTVEHEWERYPDLFAGDPAVPPADGGHFTVRDVPTNLSGTFLTDVVVQYGDSGATLEYTIHNVPIDVAGTPYLKAQWVESSDSRLDFGVVAPGTPVTKQLRLTNYGTAPLTIHQISESYDDTEISGFTAGTVLAPGDSTEATVAIDTTGMSATITRDVVVQSNAHDGWPGAGATQTVRLAGTVTETTGSSWEEMFCFHANGDLKGLAVGDTDGDGNHEIVTLGAWDDPEVQVFENVGNNQYVERWSYTLTTSGYLSEGVDLLAVADINGDGKDDIVCGVYSDGASGGKLFLIQSSADNSWSVTWSTTTNGILNELILGDSDGDGRKEIIYSTYWHADSQHGHLCVLENRGGTSFAQILDIRMDESSGSYPAYRSFGGMAVGDSDRDGHPELIFTAGSRAHEWDTKEAQFFIYESTGDNSFASRYAGLSHDVDDVGPWGFARVAIGDPDADGLCEIILAEDSNESLIIIESPSNDVWNTDPTSWEFQAIYPRDSWVVLAANVDGDPAEEILLGFDPANTTGLVIVDGFAADSYVEVWQGPDFWGEVYSLAVDNTDDSGMPRIIVGTDSGSDVDPDVIAYGQVLRIDVAVTEAGFSASPATGVEGEGVLLSARVWNTQSSSVDDVVVRFFDGDPEAGGIQIGPDQVITSIAGKTSEVAEVSWQPSLAGVYDLYVVVDPDDDLDETDEANNTATRSFDVSDDDTEGPTISDVVVAEYDGDGDAVIGADEQLQISWNLSDPSGIGFVELLVDGQSVGVTEDGGHYYAVLGPLNADGFSALEHDFVINATDADNSPASSQYTGAFEVVSAEEITILYDGEPLLDGISETDFGTVLQGIAAVPKIFIVRNDGEQALALGPISTPAGFTASGPASSVVPPGGSTHFTVTLITSDAGVFSGEVSLANSDGPRTLDGLDENPFSFAVSGMVAADPAPYITAVELNDRPGRTVSDIEPSGIGVRTIDVEFSEAVTLDPAAVVVQTVAFPDAPVTIGRAIEQPTPDTVRITLGDPGSTVGVVDTWVKVTLDSAGIADMAGNPLDGDPKSNSSGLGYIYDAALDLPSGNGAAGGDAVFYVGSLRGDFRGFGPEPENDPPDGNVDSWDIGGFTQKFLENDLDADFRGFGPEPENDPPNGDVDSWDIGGFTSWFLTALANGTHLENLPTSDGGGVAIGAPSPLRPLAAEPPPLTDSPEVALLAEAAEEPAPAAETEAPAGRAPFQHDDDLQAALAAESEIRPEEARMGNPQRFPLPSGSDAPKPSATDIDFAAGSLLDPLALPALNVRL